MDDKTIQLKIQQARSAGIPEPIIQDRVNRLRSNVNQPQTQKPVNRLQKLAGWLPTIGSTVGEVFGPGGAALGGGAGELARQAITPEDDFNIGNIAKEATLGAAGGLATKGILKLGGKVLSKVAGGADDAVKVGAKLRQSVIKPKIATGPLAVKEAEKLTEKAGQLGLKGSAQAQRYQSAELFEGLTKQIQEKLSTLKSTRKLKPTLARIKSVSDDSINFSPGDAAFEKLRDRSLSKLKQMSSGGKLTPKNLFDYKQQLGKRLSKAFDKLDKGAALTDREAVEMSLWESMDGIIQKAAPSVKDLTVKQSNLFRLAPGLEKQAKAGINLPFVGKVEGSARPYQAVVDNIGRGMQSIPGQFGKLKIRPEIGNIASNVAGQTGVRGVANYLTEPINNEQLQNPISNENFNNPTLQSTAIPQPKQLIDDNTLMKLTITAIANGDDGALKMLEAIKGFQAPGTSELTSDQKKQLGKLSTAETIVDQIESELSGISGTGRIGGAISSSLGKLGLNDQASAFNSARSGTTSLLVKSLGEVGALSDQDIKRADELLPKITDTPGEAQKKLRYIRNLIEQTRQGITNVSMY